MADFPFIGPRCHSACSVDCAECFRARSESVGNEFDRDTGPSPLGMKVVLTWLALALLDALGFVSAVGVVIGLFMLAAHWDDEGNPISPSSQTSSASLSNTTGADAPSIRGEK